MMDACVRLAAPPDLAQPRGMERKLMPDWMVTPDYGRELLFECIATAHIRMRVRAFDLADGQIAPARTVNRLEKSPGANRG